MAVFAVNAALIEKAVCPVESCCEFTSVSPLLTVPLLSASRYSRTRLLDSAEPVMETLAALVRIELFGELTTGVAGATRSTVIDSGVAALLLFPARSLTACSGMPMVTTPSAVGVTTIEYVEPLPVKLLAVPFVTVKSLNVSPVIASPKSTVIGSVDAFVGEESEVDSTGVGAVWSVGAVNSCRVSSNSNCAAACWPTIRD